MPDWRDFERLGEQIYAELSPEATVVRNDYIRGHTSEINRQIDVSIRWTDEHGEYLIAVQMKDEAAKADVNTVGTFLSVLQDINADRGILVTRSGLSAAAQTYAKNLGIDLHALHDAQSIKWNRELKIPILWTDLTPVIRPGMEARFEADDTIHVLDVHRARQGESVPFEHLDIMGTFVTAWNSGALPRDVGVKNGVASPDGWLFTRALRPAGNIEWREIARYHLAYIVTRRCWLGKFEPTVCRGIVDITNGDRFMVSHLPMGEIPVVRDERWGSIDSPDEVATRIRGSFVTSEGYQIDASSANFDGVEAIYLGP